MKYQAIIFDKDGTVLDFNAFWISVSKGVVNDLIKKFNVNISNKTFLTAIGVFDETSDPNGVLCKGTYDHNPNFTNFVKETNLPFKAYSEFKKDDVLSHCELYRQISELIWGKI